MKRLNPIAAALTGIFSVAATGSAFALDPNVDGAPEVEIRMSGATAQDGSILGVMRLVCKANTLDGWFATAGVGVSNFLYYCNYDAGQTDINLGIADNKRLMVRKSSGGSGQGVTNVGTGGTGSTTQFLATTALGACAAAVPIPADGSLKAFSSRNCGSYVSSGTWITGLIPVVGLSDVEPRFFSSNATLLANLSSTQTNQVIFGVVANLKLYRALQNAQSKVSADASDWNCTQDAAWNAGTAAATDIRAPRNDCEINMPTLDRNALSGVFVSSGLSNWSQIKDAAGNTAVTPGLDDNIYVARRSTTSGTQKAAENYFLQGAANCRGLMTFVPGSNDTTSCATATNRVFNGTTSDDVLSCLANLNGYTGAGATGQTGDKYAIGIQTTEAVTPACKATDPSCVPDPAKPYRYIKIDGYAPTLINAYNVKYTHVHEATCNVALGTNSPATNNGGAAPSGGADVAAVVAALCQTAPVALGRSDIIGKINARFISQFGDSGLMATPSTTNIPGAQPITVATLRTNPTSTATRALGGAPNACNEYTPLSPVSAF